jgi:hypothetical protein
VFEVVVSERLVIEEVMEDFDYVPRCNFCSREISDVTRMIAGEECHICNHCVDALHDIVHTPAATLAYKRTASGVPRLEFYRGKDDKH